MPHFEFDAMVNIEADSVMEAAETLHEIANSEGFVMALGKAGTLNVANYRAFVDELKGVMDQWELIGRETFTALLRKHNLESDDG